MHTSFKAIVAAASCLACCLCGPARAADTELEKTVQVAGQHLRLNGAGISFRLVFKVYAIGLYLPDQRRTPQAVLASSGPRRLFIRLLRDVSAGEFEDAVLGKLAEGGSPHDRQTAAQMLRLGKAIAAQPQGLRRGDLLTLDWVPGIGTVVELNRRPLTPPLQDIAFYNALLNIWLGDDPADERLKTALLSPPA